MSAYLLLFGTAICACVTLSQRDRRINYFFLKLLLLFLVFFIGFRHQVGGDWGNYQDIYDMVTDATWQQAIVITEPGYGFINWFFYQLGLTIHFVNFFCAILFIWGLGRLCLSQPQPWFALLIAIPYLLSAVAMGYTRQSVAIGISMVALVMLLEQRPWRFVTLIIFAALFHKTVVILFVLLPLALPQLQIGKLLIVGFFAVCSGLLLVMDRLGGMWDLYVSQGMESDGGLVRTLLNVIPAIFFLLIRKKWQQLWPNSYPLILYLSLAALVMLPLQFLASTAIDRVSLYIIPLQLMVFSGIPMLFDTVTRYVCYYGVVILYSAVYFVWLNYSFWAQCCWIPYNNLLLLP